MWTLYVLSVEFTCVSLQQSKCLLGIHTQTTSIEYDSLFFSFYLIEAVLVHSFDPYFRLRNNSYKRLIDIQLSLFIYRSFIIQLHIIKEQLQFSKWDLMWTLLDPLSSFEKMFVLFSRFAINFSVYLSLHSLPLAT